TRARAARKEARRSTPTRDVIQAIRPCAGLVAALSLFSSCSFFSPQAPLPRRAAIEPTGSEEKFATLVQDADIIYYPSESVARDFWSRDLPEIKVRVAYEAALVTEQFAARKILEHFHQHPTGKILVFLRREHLGHDYGVPYFVAQKTKARQLILNPQRHSDPAGLLARQ